MGDILKLEKRTTLEFEAILFLKEYTRPETLLQGRFVHVRKHGLYAEWGILTYIFDIGIGVSETPKVNSLFYNIPIVELEPETSNSGLYILRHNCNARDLSYVPIIKNSKKDFMYEYSNSMCLILGGPDKRAERRKLQTRF